jgi:hypothetical protein
MLAPCVESNDAGAKLRPGNGSADKTAPASQDVEDRLAAPRIPLNASDVIKLGLFALSPPVTSPTLPRRQRACSGSDLGIITPWCRCHLIA